MITSGSLRTAVSKFSTLRSQGVNAYQRRWLGQAPRGKNVEDFDTAWEEAKKLFYKPALSYQEFAKRAEALRMFVFWGFVTFAAVDLAIHPPESSYWGGALFSNFKRRFSKSEDGHKLPFLGSDNMTSASREYHRVCNI
ncbi:hypothetical protein BEWA_024290 [Theileria equi strain WA]|uniref:Uncharacterized protein n=1 Tax=Theileria equi strain WA TaxID=1537102 RepID=L0AVK4_THEEQ|nr:hypothetical protein BEWA_024290 [Theileria equi strain WA]AFZ79580.1 hypothetical protein BEWA_024290 [Theileria equi strain WA]|eukprot:XP_004829246.1 hypothetical protein BEWA_024290 [Theileria equi strain WA]